MLIFGKALLRFLPLGKVLGLGIAVASVGFGVYSYGYGVGKTEAVREAAKELAAYKDEVWQKERQQTQLLAEANEKNFQVQRKYEQELSKLHAEYAAEQEKASLEDARTIADLRNGNQRLRLKIDTLSCPERDASPPNSPRQRSDGTATAQLEGKTSAALWAIASEGDRAIRKLTALQKWVEKALEVCSADKELVNETN